MQVDLVVLVPVRPARLRAGGFNQTEPAGRGGRRLDQRPSESGALQCVRETSLQTGRGREDRRTNRRAAFVARAPLEATSILLVDDMMSTGSTGAECARALQSIGVKQVARGLSTAENTSFIRWRKKRADLGR